MAVNIHEELVKTYLQTQGYFIMENVSFGLKNDTASDNQFNGAPSDIDILAIAPRKMKLPVLAVSCKGHTAPFDACSAAKKILDGGKLYNREAWRSFRELGDDDWAASFRKKIYDLSGSKSFQHKTAVIKLTGNHTFWRKHPVFVRRMGGNELGFLEFGLMTKQLIVSDKMPHRSSAMTQFLEMAKAA